MRNTSIPDWLELYVRLMDKIKVRDDVRETIIENMIAVHNINRFTEI